MNSRSVISGSGARIAVRAFIWALCVALVACGGDESGDSDQVVGPPPDVRIEATACRLDPDQGVVLIDVAIAGEGILSGQPIDASADTQVMTVTGVFEEGERELDWTTETTGTSNVLRLSLRTSEVPAAIRIANVTFAVLDDAIVAAPSIGDLQGGVAQVAEARGKIAGIDVLGGGVGFEFVLTPVVYAEDLIVAGLQQPVLRVGDETFEDEGFTQVAPGDGGLVQRTIFPTPGEALAFSSGPAEVALGGVILEHTGVVELDTPRGCE
jgi:hypothetical protein